MPYSLTEGTKSGFYCSLSLGAVDTGHPLLTIRDYYIASHCHQCNKWTVYDSIIIELTQQNDVNIDEKVTK